MKTETYDKREEEKRRGVRTDDKRKKGWGRKKGNKEKREEINKVKKGARTKGDRGAMTREKERARTRKRGRNKIGECSLSKKWKLENRENIK